MSNKVMAYVHSLKDKSNDRNVAAEVDIIEYRDNNHVIAEYNGVRCTAIFNVFVGMYYVDDIYGVLTPPNERGNTQKLDEPDKA